MMITPKQEGEKFGIWLRKKRNFYLFCFPTFGIPTWLIVIWGFWDEGGVLFIVFMTAMTLLVTLMWTSGMWHLFVVPLVKRLGGNNDAI